MIALVEVPEGLREGWWKIAREGDGVQGKAWLGLFLRGAMCMIWYQDKVCDSGVVLAQGRVLRRIVLVWRLLQTRMARGYYVR